jgi:hypothetical protein
MSREQAKTGRKLTGLQRNLNNCFAYDLVPSPSVLTAAIRAARRVNDFPSAVRVFEGTQSHRISDMTTTAHIHHFPCRTQMKPYLSLFATTHATKRMYILTHNRHQVQGREQGPVRRISPGARAHPRGAWYPAERALVP